MNDNIIELIKEKPLYIPNILFKNYKKLNITESELILLIYFLNNEVCFDPKMISKTLDISLEVLMDLITSLTGKGIINLVMTKGRIKEEYIELEGLYKKLFFTVIKDEKEDSSNLYDIFEKEFGRTLSPMDFEIISMMEKDYSEELILLALKEAVFNGASNLKYIDKILFNWNKKGIKNKDDVIKDKKEFISKKETKKKLFDYDWLNERDS